MSAPRTPRRGAEAPRAKRPDRPAWVLGLVLAAVVVAAGAWLLLRPGTESAGPGGLPGPLGGPSVAVDVNTLVGKPAPAFRLADSEGKTYTVTPGQGRPLVLVSHMGIT